MPPIRNGLYELYSAEINSTEMTSRCKSYAEGENLQQPNGQKKRPTRKESGVFRSGETLPLADRLDDQSADCEECYGDEDRGNGRDGELLLPPAVSGAWSIGE